ncbi:MAG: hypothetical protein VXW31_02870, partial [Planctomycetota bacterium]|nr:hypothetical protein [Planctomycetota bacterium]
MPRRDVVEVPAMSEGLCVSNVFQSNMVLQRAKPIALWGRARPGARVSVSFGGALATVEAGADRRWRAALPAMPASAESRTITVQSGGETLTLENVLVGDVWVLGGQSNMEFELAKVENGALEIVSARDPLLRILTVPYGKDGRMRESFPRLHEWSDWFKRHFRKGDWDVCSPEVARELSAIGYAFARRLRMATGVPIGVIDASRGGTTVETWTPLETMRELGGPAATAKVADWDQRVAAFDPARDLETRIERHRQRMERFAKEGRKVREDEREPPSEELPGPIADPNHPGNCYAAMLGPLRGLAVKGVVFHQGYNNALDGTRGVRLYEEVFPVMIASWRETFGDPELPFGILSLCTDGYPQTREDYVEKMLNPGIEIRAAQYRTFLELWQSGDRHIGFASTYDLRRRWYHPQVKIPAGERLARWALATQYGFERDLPWKPPALVEMTAVDGALHLQLDADVSDPEDGAIQGFAIAGADRRFQPADAAYLQVGEDARGRPRFDRKRLVLSSPLVPEPVHFRYGWGRNPLANLQRGGNKDLPFATQRSDDWDMGTWPLGALDEPIDGAMTRAQRGKVLRALRAEDRRRALMEARALLDGAEPGG